MLPTTAQAASTESTQVSSPFVDFIIFTAQCGQLLYVRIIIILVRSSRERVFVDNSVFLHKFYTTRQDLKFHCIVKRLKYLHCLKKEY